MITKARQREHEEERASVRAHILQASWGYKCDCHRVVNICSQNANPYNMSKQRCFQIDTRIENSQGKTSRGKKGNLMKKKNRKKNPPSKLHQIQFIHTIYVLHSVGEMDLYWILFRFSYSHNESVSQLHVLFYFYDFYGTSSRVVFFPVGGMRHNEDWPLSKSDSLCGASGSATTL